jgi:hypothetical protein
MKKISKYWERLNTASNDLIDEFGIDCFKESVARIYNDDMGHEVLMASIRELWDYLYEKLPHELLDQFSEPLIGSPRYLLCDDRPVTADLGLSLWDYNTLSKYIDFNEIDKITEIGGGYGRLAYVILKLHPHIQYTMCDVEPALGIAKWYLPQVLYKPNIRYIHPEDLHSNTDLAIACNCLHEMTPEQVHYYFKFFDNNARYVYYTCWKDTTMPIDGTRWEQHDYPIRDTWTKLIEQDYIKDGYFEVMYKT